VVEQAAPGRVRELRRAPCLDGWPEPYSCRLPGMAHGGPSKFDCAIALLRYAHNRRKCKPQVVLFDSW
jgi:hypothetical protein